MSKLAELAKNFGVFALASLATKLTAFVCLPIYTLCLAEGEYAVLDLSQTTVSILCPLLSCSINEGLLRFALRGGKNQGKMVQASVLVTLVATVVPVAGLGVVKMAFGSYEASLMFVAYYVGMLWNGNLSYLARAVGRVSLVAVASLVTSGVVVGLTVLTIYFLGWGLPGFFVSSIVGCSLGCLVYAISLRKVVSSALRERPSWSVAKEMLMFSLPLVPNSLFWMISTSAGKYVLAALGGLAAAGLFSAASKIPSILAALVGVFKQAFSLSAFKEFDEGGIGGFSLGVFRAYRFLILTLSVLLVVFVPFLASVFLQSTFYDAWALIPVLVVAAYYSAMSSYFGSVLSAAMETGSLFATTLVGAVTNVMVCLLAVPLLAERGACLALLLANYGVYLARKRKCGKVFGDGVSLSRQEMLGFLLLVYALLRPFVGYGVAIAGGVAVLAVIVLATKEEMAPIYAGVKGKVSRLWASECGK